MAFNSARADAFYQWSEAQLDSRRGATSTSYLPAELATYASTFDQYGSWNYQAPYGYVWYPTVASTWRPYYDGRWRFYGGFGWTFIGRGSWGWPTHHYGRWGLGPHGNWFWIPSRGWSAAWVHWAVAPGYVGWCPLGWNNQPVLGFYGHGSWGRGSWGNGYPGGYNPRRAWTVIPAGAFSRGTFVPRAPRDPQVFRGGNAPAFVLQPTAPNVAVPRGAIASVPRATGPSVMPRGDHSRRGAPTGLDPYPRSGAAATLDGGSFTATRRGPAAVTAPAAVTPPVAVMPPAAVTPPVYTNRGSRVQRTPGADAPPVIYYRGSRVQSGSDPASAYDRAGVAVPRTGLPARPNGGSPTVTESPRYRSGGTAVVPRADQATPYSASPRSGGQMRPSYPARQGSPYSAPGVAVPRAPQYQPPPSRSMAPVVVPRSMGGPAPSGRVSGPPPSRGVSGPPPSAPAARTAPAGGGQGTAVSRSGPPPRR
jgi:hypothetical protein